MRQLVTIRQVSELIPIDGADRIELAKVDGWQCVVKKGDFAVGDNGFYFEIDSMIPSDDERFAFLSKGKVQAHYRIKSMKLRKALSQGLLMPMSILTDDESEELAMTGGRESDLTEFFRVQKYEAPTPIGGEQKGNFPTHLVPKTDQERIQNIPRELIGRRMNEFEVTEKLDGTSCTFWYNNTGFTEEDFEDPVQGHISRGICVGVASRNWEMKLDDDNVYAKIFNDLDLSDKLRMLGRNIAIQGEIIGGKVQGNKYKRGKQEFYVFDIYDIDQKHYLGFWDRWELVKLLGLEHVPILSEDVMEAFGIYEEELTLDKILKFADGESKLYPTPREGIVFKSVDGDLSFKVISNKFLLKSE